MAVITWTHVTDHAAELSAVSTAARVDILAHVNTLLDVAEFGGESGARLKLARVYLAAHLGTMSLRAGAGGQVTSESAGGISASYAVLPSADELAATSYGQSFGFLVRMSPTRAGILL